MRAHKKFLCIILSALALNLSVPKDGFSYAGEGIVHKVWSLIQAFKEKDVFDNECFAKKLLKSDKYEYDRFRVARKTLLRVNSIGSLQNPIFFTEVLDAISELLRSYRFYMDIFDFMPKDPCLERIRIFLENPALKDVEDFIIEMPDNEEMLPFSIPDMDFIYLPSPRESTLPITEVLRQQGIRYDRLGEDLQRTLEKIDDFVWEHREEVRNGLMIAAGMALATYSLPSLANLLRASLATETVPAFLFVMPYGDNIFCKGSEDPKENGPSKDMSYYDCELKPMK